MRYHVTVRVLLANLKGKHKGSRQDSGDPQNVLSLEVSCLLYGCILPCVLAVLRRSSSLRSHGKHVKLLQQENRMRVVERAQEKQDESVPYEKPLKLGLVSSTFSFSFSFSFIDLSINLKYNLKQNTILHHLLTITLQILNYNSNT